MKSIQANIWTMPNLLFLSLTVYGQDLKIFCEQWTKRKPSNNTEPLQAFNLKRKHFADIGECTFYMVSVYAAACT